MGLVAIYNRDLPVLGINEVNDLVERCVIRILNTDSWPKTDRNVHVKQASQISLPEARPSYFKLNKYGRLSTRESFLY